MGHSSGRSLQERSRSWLTPLDLGAPAWVAAVPPRPSDRRPSPRSRTMRWRVRQSASRTVPRASSQAADRLSGCSARGAAHAGAQGPCSSTRGGHQTSASLILLRSAAASAREPRGDHGAAARRSRAGPRLAPGAGGLWVGHREGEGRVPGQLPPRLFYHPWREIEAQSRHEASGIAAREARQPGRSRPAR